MTGKERHNVNIICLKSLKSRYRFTPEEAQALDLAIIELEADPRRRFDRSGAIETADRSGATWKDKAEALFTMAYYAGRLDGSENIIELYKMGYETGAGIRRQRKRK